MVFLHLKFFAKVQNFIIRDLLLLEDYFLVYIFNLCTFALEL